MERGGRRVKHGPSTVLERDRRWWLAERSEAHHQVCRIAEHLLDAAQHRHQADLRHARMYGNAKLLGLGPSRYATVDRVDRGMALNVVASVVDTAASKIAKNKPAPKFLPNGGDWSLRRKAKKLNKFGKGVLHASRAYRERSQVFRDACIFGTGIAKVLERDGDIYCERRFPWEILVDDQESVYGSPRTLVECHYVDKAILLERFGGSRNSRAYQAILDAKPTDRDTPTRDTLSEQIEVFEAWHLPSGKGAKDGRHVVVMQDWTFVDEPWTRDDFPFAVYRWVEPVAGWWGQGIAERLTPIQFEINKLLRRIQDAHHRLGIPWVISDAAAGIPESHITNDIGIILTTTAPGSAPRVQVNQTIHPEIYAHVWTLEEKAYAQEGISQMYAQGRKAPGLNSGVAQRERNDIESERFILAGQRWEDWHMDVVRLALDCVRELGDDYTIDVPCRKWAERVKWSDVAMAPDSYNMQVWPISILPQTPEARLEKAQEMFGAGLMSAAQLAEALDLPDDRTLPIVAASEAIEWAIDRMLDTGEFVPPEPLDNLELAKVYALTSYHEERIQGAPEDRLELLREYIDAADELMQPPAGGGAPGPMPPGADAAPPPDPAADALGGMQPVGSA